MDTLMEAIMAATEAQIDMHGFHSDVYKEVHNIRPRWLRPEDRTVEEWQAMIDRLVEEGRTTFDPAARRAAYARLEARLHELGRQIVAADLVDGHGRLLRFEIRATAFCHRMVRSIVGTVQVARDLAELRDVETGVEHCFRVDFESGETSACQ